MKNEGLCVEAPNRITMVMYTILFKPFIFLGHLKMLGKGLKYNIKVYCIYAY